MLCRRLTHLELLTVRRLATTQRPSPDGDAARTGDAHRLANATLTPVAYTRKPTMVDK
ncbi:MAG: hypothetical protein V7K35_19770 [Nostoc sp.]|uniref:hypothetical protein n=1 Tax=Nostoc sp. TaxID=1180 RepID=UPI002FFCC2B9